VPRPPYLFQLTRLPVLLVTIAGCSKKESSPPELKGTIVYPTPGGATATKPSGSGNPSVSQARAELEAPIEPDTPLPESAAEPRPVYDDLPAETVAAFTAPAARGKAGYFLSGLYLYGTNQSYAFSEGGSRVDKELLPGFSVSAAGEKNYAAWPVSPKPFGLFLKRMTVTPALVAALLKQPNLVRLEIGKDCTFTADAFAPLGKHPALRELVLGMTRTSQPGDLGVLSEFPTLTSLAVTDNEAVTEKTLKGIGAMSNLRDLNLHDSAKLTDAALTHLAGLKHLRTLNLSLCSALTGDGLKAVGQIRSLERLNLSFNGLGDHGVRYLAPLGRLKSLSYSSGSAPTSPAAYDAAVVAFARFPYLESLSYTSTLLNDAALTQIGKCSRLKNIDFDRGGTVTGFAPLANLKNLEHLKLSFFGKVTPDGWKALALLPGLTRLEVTNSAALTTDAMLNLSEAGTLERLYLFDTGTFKFNDDGLKNIAKLTKLTDLTLTGKGLTGKSFPYLIGLSELRILHFGTVPEMTDADVMQLAKLKKLRNLVLSDTQHRLNPVTIAELRKALPDCSFPEYAR
jgi:Leucine-rich repeat (LRR) protein